MITSISQKLGIISVPSIAVLAFAFGVFGLAPNTEWQSAVLETVLTIGIILPASLVIVWVSGRGFLRTGFPNLLLLGLAVFEFGFSSALGGIILHIDASEGIELAVVGALLASFIHLASAVLTYRGTVAIRTRLNLLLWFSYLATVIFVVLLSFLILGSSTLSPIAQPGTLTEQVFTGTIVVTFLASAFIFSRVYSRSRSPILFWYSLALATTSFAYLAFFVTQDNGDLATWIGVGGLCLASCYFLKSVLTVPKAKAALSPMSTSV